MARFKRCQMCGRALTVEEGRTSSFCPECMDAMRHKLPNIASTRNPPTCVETQIALEEVQAEVLANQMAEKKGLFSTQDKIKDIKSTGYVVDTLEAVLHSLLKFDNYKDIVLYSINLGDDTDTVGAITGGLAGMYYKDIPMKWINNLKKIDLINKLIEDFYNKINSLK